MYSLRLSSLYLFIRFTITMLLSLFGEVVRRIFIGTLGGLFVIAPSVPSNPPIPTVTPTPPLQVQTGALSKFTSCVDLQTRLQASAPSGRAYADKGIAMPFDAMNTPMAAPAPTMMRQEAGGAATLAAPADYSQTNVQVAGVDEGDIVKSDGNYLYHAVGNRVMISQITPTSQAKLASTITTDANFMPQELFIDGNRLMLIGQTWSNEIYPTPSPVPVPLMKPAPESRVAPTMPSIAPAEPMPAMDLKVMPIWRGGRNVTHIEIWDVSDRAKPSKARTVEFDGSLSATRLINGRAYFVMNTWSPWDQTVKSPADKDLIPAFRDSSQSNNTAQPMAGCGDIAYFPQPSQQFLAIASVPMTGSEAVSRTVILGTAGTVYANQNNLFTANQEWVNQPVRDSIYPNTSDQEQTVIHKFSLQNGQATHIANTSVPGRMINQFALDEYENNLRVATVRGYIGSEQQPSQSNIYVLGADLKARGKIEGIAPNENMYSVRFMGKRAYMVTFRQIDPFFAIDLANPDAPKILGKLKIPGYSTYLHPMTDNLIIGVGKNTAESANKDFAWYQGMKIAVFDVTDVTNPVEKYHVDIGDRGTDSPALNDHRAFLYSPTKQILALPVMLAELSAAQKAGPDASRAYGEYTFQGAYIYKLTPQTGFTFLGRVTQAPDADRFLKSGWYPGSSDRDIQRVGYVDDTLWTISNGGIGLNRLPDLAKQGAVDYPVDQYQDRIYPPIDVMPMTAPGASGGGSAGWSGMAQ